MILSTQSANRRNLSPCPSSRRFTRVPVTENLFDELLHRFRAMPPPTTAADRAFLEAHGAFDEVLVGLDLSEPASYTLAAGMKLLELIERSAKPAANDWLFGCEILLQSGWPFAFECHPLILPVRPEQDQELAWVARACGLRTIHDSHSRKGPGRMRLILALPGSLLDDLL